MPLLNLPNVFTNNPLLLIWSIWRSPAIWYFQTINFNLIELVKNLVGYTKRLLYFVLHFLAKVTVSFALVFRLLNLMKVVLYGNYTIFLPYFRKFGKVVFFESLVVGTNHFILSAWKLDMSSLVSIESILVGVFEWITRYPYLWKE